MSGGTFIKQGTALVQDAVTACTGHSEGLTVLTARFLFRSGGTMVNLNLACGRRRPGTDAGLPEPVSWEVPLTELLSDEASSAPRIQSRFVVDVLARLHALEGGASKEPLWLKLARPYGMLGTAPWERAMGQAMQRPVLRLPDFPERPAQRPDVLESAVLVDPGPDAPWRETVERVRALVRSILRGSGRSGTRVHVFCSAVWFPLLKQARVDARVQIHAPIATPTSVESLRSQRAQNLPILRSAPWSNWIADVMAARGVDAVFLLCRAQRSDTGAEIILSCSPSAREKDSAVNAIDEEEICLLLNRAGAWSLTLLPETAAQPQALAFVADSLAHRWPGVTLFHTLAGANGQASLRAAFKLLFSKKPVRAPMIGDGFLYCQPGFVRGAQAPVTLAASSVLAEGARLLARRAPLAERLWSKISHALPGVAEADQSVPPNWVGSAQRFLESAMFDEVRKAAPDVLLAEPAPEKGDAAAIAPDPAAADTLREIENVVDDYLRTHKEG
jgi:hypothetical protein